MTRRKITEILMFCQNCKWIGSVIQCDSDGDYPKEEDDGRLRCPKCGCVVNQTSKG